MIMDKWLPAFFPFPAWEKTGTQGIMAGITQAEQQ